MRRILLVLVVGLVMAAILAINAVPSMAENSGNQPPGPPQKSGTLEGSPGNGATVDHCNQSPGVQPGVTLVDPNGVQHGNGNCYI